MKFDIRTSEPEVSILVVAYNHGPYIRTCLDSLLEQETTFPYEICIGEDASTDGTREICMEYAQRHPDRIRLVLHSRSAEGREEYYAQGNYNYVETLRMCRGKYIADCDGDDFWCDPHKLQQQYEVLECDSGIALVHTDYGLVDRTGARIVDSVALSSGLSFEVNEDKDTFLYDILNDIYHIRTVTVMMRKDALLLALDRCREDLKQLPMADLPMWCEVLRHGNVAYLDRPTACYRQLPESACNSDDPLVKARFVNRASDLWLFLSQRHNLPIPSIWSNKIKNCNRYAIMSGEYDEMDQLHSTRCDKFSSFEHFLYHIGRNPLFRQALKAVYVHTYRKNQNGRHDTRQLRAS